MWKSTLPNIQHGKSFSVHRNKHSMCEITSLQFHMASAATLRGYSIGTFPLALGLMLCWVHVFPLQIKWPLPETYLCFSMTGPKGRRSLLFNWLKCHGDKQTFDCVTTIKTNKTNKWKVNEVMKVNEKKSGSDRNNMLNKVCFKQCLWINCHLKGFTSPLSCWSFSNIITGLRYSGGVGEFLCHRSTV